MSFLVAIKKYIQSSTALCTEKQATQAYNLWAATYDNQPDNLMLYLDTLVFTALLRSVTLKNKIVVDIGCGTGRHWSKILTQLPQQLTGFDVSEGMLTKLKEKFPQARTKLITDNLLLEIPDQSVDTIISTLTIAHISNLQQTLQTWYRILKDNGDILLTDFHPQVLANGGKRNFQLGKKLITIKNYVHPLADIKMMAIQNKMWVVQEAEKKIDDSVKHFYEKQNALSVFERFKGMPIIYGLHLKK